MTRRALVLSLLRAGDTLVHLPALAALRAAEPGLEVHLLVQASAGPAVELLATQAQVHRLPRDYTGGPLDDLEPALAPLRALAFDRVINLTLKGSAAALAASLGGRSQEGLFLHQGRLVTSSPWLTALNDWGTTAPLSVLHYGDVACQALGQPWTDPRLQEALPAAAQGWWSVQRGRLGLHPSRPLVALQLTTSEPKKSYPLARWRPFALALAARRPEVQLVALASPSELPAVAEALAGTAATALPCSLAEAARLLADAALLVTGDTALVHLAALVGARVLLLSSGSSAFRELGPAGAGHLVVQAPWPCAPCAHDPGCLASASTFPCTEALAPEPLAALAAAALGGDELDAGGGCSLYRSQRDDQGLLQYLPLTGAGGGDACAGLLRDYLLSGLPVAQATGAARAPAGSGTRPAPPAPAGLLALSELRQVVGGLLRQVAGDRAARLDLGAIGTPFVLAFASAVGGRVREASTAGRSEGLATELRRLDQALADALAPM